VTWIVLGALTIAVMASVLPARRAARLHPVEALRYE
jgi:lipoprotein-releasing system permease protein